MDYSVLSNVRHELETSSARYQELYDRAPIAYFTFDQHGVVLDVNQSGAALLGRERSRIVGGCILALATFEPRGLLFGHIRDAIAAQSPVTSELRMSTALGTRDLQFVSVAGEARLLPTACHTAVLDVTQQRAAERRARAAHEAETAAQAHEYAAARRYGQLLRGAIESTDDAIALFDADERLVLCNQAYEGLVAGLVDRELSDCRFADICAAWLASATFVSDDERAALAAGARIDLGDARRFELRTSEGRNLRVMTRRTPEGGFVQTIWDLSENLRREAELREARSRAEAASTAKSEFLSSMSHELRTPLNAILGFAQLLERDRKLPLAERHRERVRHILKGGEHLLHLIEEILDLSRIEARRITISPARLELPELLEDVRNTLAMAAAQAAIELTIELPAGPLVVTADRTRLKQALINFGTNAIKYGRAGGHVRFHTSSSAGFARITVSDDGIGIAPDKQARIFEPFQRAGQEYGTIDGAGIGLALTKQLAELMSGRAGFRSVQGEGSDFWIELPLVAI